MEDKIVRYLVLVQISSAERSIKYSLLTVGKTERGASSPAKPALLTPEPLSITRAGVSAYKEFHDGGNYE
jgi:hypothetical protein